ncbi:branched-chain-amino-acid transaminase [Bacillus halotolerans]|uniref:branched-chain-amino-acid transaminase n=1 Tax=Bacillus halotolerans TaxID=260554 RepID=UPI000D061B7C|nr:branched-chain-amino-acid transaminase [Bacillus halotolerans]MEC1408526.1 branched-chain-amino-acid transaminase [Bacillus halotolerans]MEC1546405.1 branched-chain-amino-acid transaminase [Bacillus halotolerans]PSA98395.1 branched-chain-amino-acid transaminase [Bacillus halotolerans]
MTTKIFIDGTFYEKSEAKISVYDHGLLYGDGIYEGLRCYSGYVFQMKEHLYRLKRSANSLRMELPYSLEEIGEYILETLRINELQNAYIRLLVTRGVGNIGPDPKTCKNTSLIIIVEDLPNVHGESVKETGLSLVIVSTRRDAVDATSHEIKSLNYLNSVVARMEANQYGADDAILLDPRGFISESTICNVFMIDKDKLVTPSPSNGILQGVTRQIIIDIAQELNIDVEQKDITPFQLINADEVFLTGTHAEVVGVTRINNIEISKGNIGEITRKFIHKFQERTLDVTYSTPVYKNSNMVR